MATSFPLTTYREEFIRIYEQRTALLRDFVTTHSIVQGREATFLLVESNRSAVTRGPNGLIPANNSEQSQVTVTLKEAHDLQQITRFVDLTVQGDQRRIMQETGRTVINREVDDEIIDALSDATTTVGAAAVITKPIVNEAITRLFNNFIENDGQIGGIITPAAWAYLTDIPAFASADYVTDRPIMNGPEKRTFMGVTWMVHPRLPGVGTNSATMFLFHKSAVGHAMHMSGMQAVVGYDVEQDYTYARHTVFHGAKLLQNAGVVKILHDDSALSS